MSPSLISPPIRVLIIGAGLGGLALAQGLKKQGIDFSVFERDSAAEDRPQGYRLKIHGDTAAALQYVLSPELWHEFESTCAETTLGETTLNSLDGSLIASRPGHAGRGDIGLLTVDRSMLRRVLIKGLEKNVCFGKPFARYELQGDLVIAHFEDGSTEEGTLLVGADGARSRVRKQYLPENKVVDTEGCCIYGKTPMTSELLERFPAKAMRWFTLCRDTTPILQEVVLGDNPITLFVEPMRFQNRDLRSDLPEDYIYWVLLFRKRSFVSTDEELSELLQRPSKELSLWITSEWDPSLRSVLEFQDSSRSSAMRIYSADPKLGPWAPTARITLLGDAIHLMSPAGGVGAVTALKDASSLARTLVNDGLSVESIAAYENSMRGFAQVMLQRSFAGAKRLFNQPPFEQCKPVNI
ncbi:hypothetical protein MMC16_005986 [Acarospora aff. strigata]|nr:hypothetical protein [Acarospora aff. strigata]